MSEASVDIDPNTCSALRIVFIVVKDFVWVKHLLNGRSLY
jgi:hypothetical protein